jgi:hypothetical protein
MYGGGWGLGRGSFGTPAQGCGTGIPPMFGGVPQVRIRRTPSEGCCRYSAGWIHGRARPGGLPPFAGRPVRGATPAGCSCVELSKINPASIAGGVSIGPHPDRHPGRGGGLTPYPPGVTPGARLAPAPPGARVPPGRGGAGRAPGRWPDPGRWPPGGGAGNGRRRWQRAYGAGPPGGPRGRASNRMRKSRGNEPPHPYLGGGRVGGVPPRRRNPLRDKGLRIRPRAKLPWCGSGIAHRATP